MSRPTDTTITARNNALFAVVDGLLKYRQYESVGDLPAFNAPDLIPYSFVLVLTPTPSLYYTTGFGWNRYASDAPLGGADGQYIKRVNGQPQWADLDVGVSVQRYGAKGDGTTNDTLAIRAAIDAAGPGGIVYFPVGFYNITDTLYPHQGQKWIGGSANGLVVLSWGSGSPGNMIRVQAPQITVEGIKLAGNNVATGILARGGNIDGNNWTLYDCVLRRVMFQQCSVGFDAETNDNALSQNDSWTFDQCTWGGCGTGVLINTLQTDFWQFRGCQWSGNDLGIHTTITCGESVFYNCLFNTSTTGDIFLELGVTNTWTFIGCQAEQSPFWVKSVGAPLAFISCVINNPLIIDNAYLATQYCKWVPGTVNPYLIQALNQAVNWTSINDQFYDSTPNPTPQSDFIATNVSGTASPLIQRSSIETGYGENWLQRLSVQDDGSHNAFLDLFLGDNAAVSAFNSGRLRYSSTSSRIEVSENGGAFYQPLAPTPASIPLITAGNQGTYLPDGSSAGDGTVMVDFPPESGLYRISVLVQVAGVDDTVSVTVGYDDFDTNQSFVRTIIDNVALTANGPSYSTDKITLVRAKSSAHIIVTLSQSAAPGTTRYNVVIERLF
jgi:hypothetical protein